MASGFAAALTQQVNQRETGKTHQQRAYDMHQRAAHRPEIFTGLQQGH